MKEYEKSDNELRMEELCRALESLKAQRHNARKAEISANIVIGNLNSLLVGAIEQIDYLKRKGIKQPEILAKEPDSKGGEPGNEQESL